MKKLISLLMFVFSLSAFSMEFGIDRLGEAPVANILSGKNLAVLTHAAGKAKDGTHLIDSLNKNYTLKKIFAPEHGLRTMADDWVEDGNDEATGLPVISLYKRGSKAPKPEDLKGIDAIVIDLQDVGVRYYTYFSTIAEVMKVCATLNVEVFILDRPNLLGGLLVEGKVLDAALTGGFASYYTVPTRHGMTLGELAHMFNVEKKLGAKLTVVTASGWARENMLTTLDRPWLAPSPALVDIDQVGLYAMWGALEDFNISVGRGLTNELAFKVLGAPWITKEESQTLAARLNALNFSQVKFKSYSWKVTRAIHVGKIANGVMIEWNGKEVRTDEFVYKVSSILVKMFKDRLNISSMSPGAYGSQTMVDAIKTAKPWESYKSVIDADLEKFQTRRQEFLLY